MIPWNRRPPHEQLEIEHRIRALLTTGAQQKDIAAEVGVTRTVVAYVEARERMVAMRRYRAGLKACPACNGRGVVPLCDGERPQ